VARNEEAHWAVGQHTEPEVERGLVALALCDGNSKRATELLATQGLKIHPSTLRDWRDNRSEDYSRVQALVLPRVKAQTAELHADFAKRAIEVNAKVLDKLEREYDEISPRELPGAVRNLSTTAGIHEDKAANLRGDPTTVIEHRSYKEVVAWKLKQMGVIEGDAEEMPEDQPALQTSGVGFPE
jgi:hypothetical protein